MADEKKAGKAEYFRILDLSKEERTLNGWDTNQKIADHIGTSTNSLQKWREKRGSGGANGGFDMRKAFLEDQKVIWDGFMGAVKSGKINAQLFRTFAQLANELVEKREDTHKVEFNANDRIRVATELCDSLISEYRDTGTCPVCGFSKILHVEPRLADGREQQPEDTVATVALSS